MKSFSFKSRRQAVIAVCAAAAVASAASIATEHITSWPGRARIAEVTGSSAPDDGHHIVHPPTVNKKALLGEMAKVGDEKDEVAAEELEHLLYPETVVHVPFLAGKDHLRKHH